MAIQWKGKGTWTPFFRASELFLWKFCNLYCFHLHLFVYIKFSLAVDKLHWPTKKHPNPYKLAWVDDHCITANCQCLVPFSRLILEKIVFGASFLVWLGVLSSWLWILIYLMHCKSTGGVFKFNKILSLWVCLLWGLSSSGESPLRRWFSCFGNFYCNPSFRVASISWA